MAIWNIRTLLDTNQRTNRPQRRTALIASELKRYKVDIAALSETRLLEEGSLNEVGEGYTFFWKGYPQGGQHLHGVGFAIKNSLLLKIPETPVGITERLMTLRIPLTKHRYATLISAYAPTLPSDIEDKDQFYQALDETLNHIPRNDKIVLLGDFNARVGSNSHTWGGVIGNHGIGNVNSNGLRLLNLCAEHDLTITNTVFQQKNKYKTSWMHPRSKHWHLIDYIIVRSTDLKDVLLTRAMRGAECWTDHRMIMSKLKLQIRPPIRRQRSGKKKLNCAALKHDGSRNALRRSIAQKLTDAEPLLSAEATVNDKWTSISSLLYAAAVDAMGYKGKRHQDWFDENRDRISTLLENMHKAHTASLNNPTSHALQKKWQDLRKIVQSSLRTMQNEWWTAKSQQTQQYADSNDMHNFYDSLKSIYGPKNCPLVPIRSADGATLIKEQKQIVERWAEHFKILLNQRNVIDDTILNEIPDRPTINDLDLPPTFSEISQAVKSLKDNKAPGPDSIPAEILKHGGYLCLRTIYKFVLEIWDKESVPQQWKDANIVTIYKNKGDKSICGNSRGIALLAAAGKILAKVMLSRIVQNISEDLLPESQCGFRRARGTVDLIFTTRQIQEKCREQHQDLFMAFIDLTKAFDTINREMLWDVLAKFGCPPKFVNILKLFHEGMMARVSIGDHESEAFNVCTGVRQGCVLAPVLFNVYLICVTTLLRRDMEDAAGVIIDFRLDGNLFNIRKFQFKTKLTSEHILELQYADDCALVAHTPEALQAALTATVNAYSRIGLNINTQKTEVLCQWNAAAPPEQPIFYIQDNELTIVSDFKYLGSFISQDCNIDTEIQNRLRQASASFGRLRERVFLNKDLNIKTKITVYQAVCISTLLYGCESWTTYSRHLKLLEAYHIRCLQRILGISWRDRVPHTDILSRTKCVSIEATVSHHQLRWLGHVIRMPEERLPRKTLYGQLHEGERTAGGQKKRYKDQMKTTLKKCNIDFKQLETLAADRSLWRSCCHEGVQLIEDQRTRQHQERRLRRHARQAAPPPPNPDFTCPVCGRQCASRIGLYSHRRTHR